MQSCRAVLAVLFNCCEPEAISLAVPRIRTDSVASDALDKSRCVLGAYANRLTAVASDWTMADSDGPQPMRKDLLPSSYCTDFVEKWFREWNVQVVGGCCGMTPEHIALLNSRLRAGRET